MAPPRQQEFLPRSFFNRPTQTVARELLGCCLIRKLGGTPLVGAIVETEAYVGERDLACHAKAGRTPRTEIMYGPPGFAYVYFTYGMHWMLNLVTEADGFPAAVLIRALQPLEGIARMQELRSGKPLSQLASGPAKLTRAMGIAREENGLDCCQADSPLTLIRGEVVPPSSVVATPRIGLGQTPEPWLSKPWRFAIRGNGFVSR
ncbi:MAG: DNA-3-methyladenine glycosylase [Acidobacteriota bacterium]|nr:DNA-3-methyladenine glycosylase [Acidobacteriota bacterium]MDE2964367.1 DNA-3-methyladenine glycosylase [Acidobacteriota bacterium]